VVAHLVWQDVKHNLRPIRALPLLLLSIFLAHRAVRYHQELGDIQDYLYFVEGALTRETNFLATVIPLLAALTGGTLAAERRAGITMTILSRGVSRHDYVRAKLLGAAASSAILTFTTIFGFWCIVFTTWIPGRAPYLEPVWIEGPVKSLFIYSPFLHDLLVAVMEITAAAALPTIGILTGLIIANEYVAMAMTPIVLILWIVMMPRGYDLLDPVEYLWLGYYHALGPQFRWLIPFAPFLYWGTFAFIISFICQRIFATKEIA
jgi:hypothetical protein